MASKVCNRRVRSENPAVSVRGEFGRIVNVHLEEIFVEAIIASNPATKCILEEASREVHVRADEPWPGLGRSWLRS